MTHELAHQLSLRVREHLYLKERKASDLAKPRRSEIGTFASQVSSNDILAKGLEKYAQEKEREEGFDKEAYQQLKNEIKQRREAKERLLQQGFPELKPYISI